MVNNFYEIVSKCQQTKARDITNKLTPSLQTDISPRNSLASRGRPLLRYIFLGPPWLAFEGGRGRIVPHARHEVRKDLRLFEQVIKPLASVCLLRITEANVTSFCHFKYIFY